MEMFSNLMEILSPSPAPKEPIKSQVIEVGTELPLRAIDGQIYYCAILVPMKGTLTRVKYILAITETQIIELYPHSSKTGYAVAAEAHELQALVKLKFKKGDQGILLLEYKNGKVSKLLMEDPAICVGHIKTKMRDMGINGSIKNKNEKIIENANGFFQEAKKIETLFSLSPSVEYVQEMMDLLRKSAEKFAEANDDSFLDVMDFIKKFLQRSDVNGVLDSKVSYPQIPHTDPEIAESNIRTIISSPAATTNPNTTTIPTSTQTSTTTTTNTATSSMNTEEPPTTPKRSTVRTMNTQYSSSIDFVPPLPLPDVDAELHTLQNALTYHFDENDHLFHTPYTPHTSSNTTTTAANKEQCELTNMLDDMTNELDTLLNSFSSSSIDYTDAHTTNDNINSRATISTSIDPSTSTTGTNNTTTATTTTSDSDIADNSMNSSAEEAFQEVDFAQTLEDMVNA